MLWKNDSMLHFWKKQMISARTCLKFFFVNADFIKDILNFSKNNNFDRAVCLGPRLWNTKRFFPDL
jgi:hypothetical protein